MDSIKAVVKVQNREVRAMAGIDYLPLSLRSTDDGKKMSLCWKQHDLGIGFSGWPIKSDLELGRILTPFANWHMQYGFRILDRFIEYDTKYRQTYRDMSVAENLMLKLLSVIILESFLACSIDGFDIDSEDDVFNGLANKPAKSLAVFFNAGALDIGEDGLHLYSHTSDGLVDPLLNKHNFESELNKHVMRHLSNVRSNVIDVDYMNVRRKLENQSKAALSVMFGE